MKSQAIPMWRLQLHPASRVTFGEPSNYKKTDSSPGDKAMLETTIALSGSMAASERLPIAHAPVLEQLNSDSGSEARRALQGPDANRLKAGKHPGAMAREISFGPFRLLPAQFLLLEGDKTVPIGSRALEILIALLERPGELISKQELMARVWPNVFVDPANLTVHVSALRRRLRDGRDGNRFIINIPGRGYGFVALIKVS